MMIAERELKRATEDGPWLGRRRGGEKVRKRSGRRKEKAKPR
jgi:hypothetical protein